MLILIPAAGTGSRFVQAGYAHPKPLVNVLGKPMIQRVLENLRPIVAHQVVIVSRLDPDCLRPFLHKNDVSLHLSQPTEGAVDTILQARSYITHDPILLANTDQLVDFNVNDFIALGSRSDGAIVTFPSNVAHHSYVRVDANGVITEIAEKQVISTQAVTGVYYFQDGLDFLHYANQVVANNDRYNKEFYVSSVIARMIRDGRRITTHTAPSFMLGTPQELQQFEVAIRVGRNVL